MVSEGIFINGEKVTFNPENILNGDVSAYTEAIGEATQDWLDEHLEPGGSVPIDDTLTIAGAAADAKKTGDEISELKENFGDITEITYGYNLYNKNAIIDGYLNADGTVHPDNGSGWKTTDFIPCKGDTTYVCTCDNNGIRKKSAASFLTEYDDAKNIIKQTSQPTSDGFKTDTNTAWIRLCNKPSQRIDFMLTEGTQLLPYVEYVAETIINNDVLRNIDYHSINPNGIIYKNLSDKLTDLIIPHNYNAQQIAFSKIDSYVDYLGNYVAYEGCSASDLIDCSNVDSIHYIGSSFYSGRCIVFLDEKQFPISAIPEESTKTVINVFVPVPKNAKYVIFGNYSSATSQPVTIEYSNGFTLASTKMWSNKKWVCIGDSLTEHNSRTTKNYHDYVSELTGINVVNMGVSGTGYMRGYDNDRAFYQRAESVPTDADVITIFGSGNDLTLFDDLGTPTDTGTSTICGCVNATIDAIIGLIPTAQIGIVSPTPWVGQQPTLDDTNRMGRYSLALKNICKIRSIPFLDLYHESNLRPWTAEGKTACYSKDDGNGVHPDETGHKLIAPRFKGFLDTLLL